MYPPDWEEKMNEPSNIKVETVRVQADVEDEQPVVNGGVHVNGTVNAEGEVEPLVRVRETEPVRVDVDEVEPLVRVRETEPVRVD